MRIVMMGTGSFAEPTFSALLKNGLPVIGLYTQPDHTGVKIRSSTRLAGSGMKGIAEQASIPIFQPASINTPEAIAELQALAPDLLVVAAYGQILKPAVIATPQLGAINVHASLLPKYRGASPIAHAILNGETESGVTIIRIVPGLDAGEMLAQEAVSIAAQETTGELEARLARLGAPLCVQVIQQLQAGPVAGVPQDSALVSKAPKFTKEHGLIDWAQPVARIVMHNRAMQPWPTAYTFFHRPGKEPMRIIINRVHAVGVAQSPGIPGEIVVKPTSGFIHVHCGDGQVLQVDELQPAGKKRMTAEEFTRGYAIQPGFHFGPVAS